MSDPDLRYPIGPFTPEDSLSPERRAALIEEIATQPQRVREAVAGLDALRWGTPYRPGGWTIRQVVHHLADAHLNAFARFKLALTEDNPTIKPYAESRWAETPDAMAAPGELSLALLDALHRRWAMLMRTMMPDDFRRTVVHPERRAPLSLDFLLALYAWHGRHHTAHITELRRREDW